MSRENDEIVIEVLQDARLGMNGWYRANCPFCVDTTGRLDKRFSFGILATNGVYHCFRCGTSGKLQTPPEWFTSAAESLPPPAEAAEEIKPPTDMYPLWMEPGLNAYSFRDARRFLRGRGFGLATWRRANLHAVLDGAYNYEDKKQRVKQRVVAPILASDGKTWLGWVGRDWTNKADRKYLYPAGMARGVLLYEHARIHEEGDDPLLVVEGVFDALPYIGDAVACLGKPSRWQVEALKESRRPIVVCLDGDAWEEAYALAGRLRLDGKRAGYVRLPPKEDPNSVDADWLKTEAKRSLRN